MAEFYISVDFNTERFHEALKKKKWNRKRLSFATGISYDTIKKYSSGKFCPSGRVLYIIAKALDVPMEELMKEI